MAPYEPPLVHMSIMRAATESESRWPCYVEEGNTEACSLILLEMLHLHISELNQSTFNQRTYEVNKEVEAEHIGIFDGVTPDLDGEFGCCQHLSANLVT